MSQTVKHTGPIKALQFNPFKPELLLTGGVKGEVISLLGKPRLHFISKIHFAKASFFPYY